MAEEFSAEHVPLKKAVDVNVKFKGNTFIVETRHPSGFSILCGTLAEIRLSAVPSTATIARSRLLHLNSFSHYIYLNTKR